MEFLISRLRAFVGSDEGQDLLEYALLVALIAIVSYVAVQNSGDAVNNIFSDIAGKLASRRNNPDHGGLPSAVVLVRRGTARAARGRPSAPRFHWRQGGAPVWPEQAGLMEGRPGEWRAVGADNAHGLCGVGAANMTSSLAARIRRQLTPLDEGQDLLEYAMLVGLIAIIAMMGVKAIGDTINDVFWQYIANAAL